MTGMADEEEVRTALRLGVSGVLVKPLTPTLLRERLSRLITEVKSVVDRQAAQAANGPRTEATLTRQLFEAESPSVTAMLDTACRLVGEPLRLPMTVRAIEPQMTPTITARWIFGSVHLQGAAGAWELCVHLPFTVALRLGAAANQVSPDQLSAADMRELVLNLALELGTMFRDDGMKNGVRLRVASGRSGEQPAGALFRTLQYGPGMARCLLGLHDQPAGAIQIIAHATAASAI
jgi:hypothetical protein